MALVPTENNLWINFTPLSQFTLKPSSKILNQLLLSKKVKLKKTNNYNMMLNMKLVSILNNPHTTMPFPNQNYPVSKIFQSAFGLDGHINTLMMPI